MKRLALAPDATARARRLRREMTDAERKLWRGLRMAYPSAHWRKQVPFGLYTADFCTHGGKLVIEADGGQHATRTAEDEARTRFLNTEGYRVLRFWNDEIMRNLEGVLEAVGHALSSPLVGEAGGGRPASAGQETPGGAENLRASSANAAVAPPSQPSPTRGEGLEAQPSAFSSRKPETFSLVTDRRILSASTPATSPIER